MDRWEGDAWLRRTTRGERHRPRGEGNAWPGRTVMGGRRCLAAAARATVQGLGVGTRDIEDLSRFMCRQCLLLKKRFLPFFFLPLSSINRLPHQQSIINRRVINRLRLHSRVCIVSALTPNIRSQDSHPRTHYRITEHVCINRMIHLYHE